MKKRLMCLVLAVALLLAAVPMSAAAAPLEGVYVTVRTGNTAADGNALVQNYNLYALEDGNDLLLSAQDLATLCGFTLQFPDSKSATFTRGYKVVKVDLTSSKVDFYSTKDPKVKSKETATLPSKVVQKNGQYYLSAAGMLPRLNVSCVLEDGLLTIVPNALSLWDFYYDVKLSDYDFDIAYCAEVLECSQKHIKSLVYTRTDLVDSIIYSIDANFAESGAFYNIFDRFVQDETATDEAVAVLQNAYGLVAKLAGSYTEVCSWMDKVFPHFSHINDAEFAKVMGKAFSVAESVAKFVTYCNLFNHDNTKKIEVLDSFINNYGFDYNDALYDAACQAKLSYEDFWLGLMFKGGYSFINDFTGAITFEGYRESLRVNYMGQLPDNKLLEHTVYLEGLMDATARIYNKGFDPNSREQVSAWYAHSFLYFYSVELIYWGMAQHVIDMDKGQWSDLQSFSQTAGKMESMYGKYLAASVYLNSDLFDNAFFTAKSSELLASLPNVKRMPNPGTVAPAAEYAMFTAALWDMHLGDAVWTIMDIDGDGGDELLLNTEDTAFHTIVLDNWSVDHHAVSTLSGNENIQMLLTADNLAVQRHDYKVGTNAFTAFSLWDGQHWTEAARWQNYRTENGQTVYEDHYVVDGAPSDAAAYQKRVAPFLSARAMEYNWLDYSGGVLECDASTVIGELVTYFNARPGFVKSVQIDVNNDLYMDRVFLLSDGLNMWMELLGTGNDAALGSEWRTFRDRKTTLLLVENYGTSVRLRVLRMELPYMETPDMLSDAKAAGTALQIWDEILYYQEHNEPFTTSPMFGKTPMDVLMGMTPEEVKAKLKDYEVWIGTNDGIAQGLLDGRPVIVHYADIDGKVQVHFTQSLQWYTTPYNICHELETDMDMYTIVRTIYPTESISTSWSPVRKVTDEYGIELCLISCYYMQYTSGNVYKLTMLYPDGNGRVLPEVFTAEYIPPEKVPGDVWTKLAS